MNERRQALRHIDRLCKYLFATAIPPPYFSFALSLLSSRFPCFKLFYYKINVLPYISFTKYEQIKNWLKCVEFLFTIHSVRCFLFLFGRWLQKEEHIFRFFYHLIKCLFFFDNSISLAEPFPLMDLCRRVIRQKIGRERLESCVHQLQLPESMKTYLLYWDRR